MREALGTGILPFTGKVSSSLGRLRTVTSPSAGSALFGAWLFIAPRASCLVPDFVVVIPARYASSRLPGKALADIAGKPMVVHVADRAREAGAAEVIVATDDDRILHAVGRAWPHRDDDARGSRFRHRPHRRGRRAARLVRAADRRQCPGRRAAHSAGADSCRCAATRRTCRGGDRHRLSSDP